MANCGPSCYRTVAQWVPASGGMVPGGAVLGGTDHSDNIFVGRARHENDIIPGKVVPSHRVCYVAHAGKEHGKSVYEVLVNPQRSNIQWIHARGGEIPSGAIQGGRTIQGEPLYIGRQRHHGTLTVGKVHPSHKCLYISYGGSEFSYRDYEILVCKTIDF